MPADYAKLKEVWPTLSGTTGEKISAINAMTITGPNIDVTVETVVGYLLLNGTYPTLSAFAKGTVGSANALEAARVLFSWITIPNAPSMQMSNSIVFAQVQAMGAALVAEEAATAGSTGFTTTIMSGLLSLCETQLPWYTQIGLSGPVSEPDIEAAGLA